MARSALARHRRPRACRPPLAASAVETARVARSRCRSTRTRDERVADGGASIGKLSQGQYGNRQGMPRILDILAKSDVKASFFVPAVTALLYPDEQRRVVAEGHEIGIHG